MPKDTGICNPWKVASKRKHKRQKNKLIPNIVWKQANKYKFIHKNKNQNLNTYLRIQTTAYEIYE